MVFNYTFCYSFSENELELIKRIKTVTYLIDKEDFPPCFPDETKRVYYGVFAASGYFPLTPVLEHWYDGWLLCCLGAATLDKDRDFRACTHGCVAQSPFFTLFCSTSQDRNKRWGLTSKQNLAASLKEVEKPQQRRAQNQNFAAAFGYTERGEMVWPSSHRKGGAGNEPQN